MMAKRSGRPKAADRQHAAEDPAIFLITYVFESVTGVIVYLAFSRGERRLKMHAMQATLIGIVSVVVWAAFSLVLPALGSLIAFLLWLYSLYIGAQAYNGRDVDVPYITRYLRAHPDFR